MGQGCLKAPRMGQKRSGFSQETNSYTQSSSHQASTQVTASPQLCNHNVCSVLRRKDWQATEELIRTGEGVDINLTKFLERALYEGCPTNLLEMLLEKGASPLDSTRCLSDAVLGKVEYQVVKRLLDMGCSPNQESEQDKLKRTPMHFACQMRTSPQIVELLIDRGGDLNHAVGERLWTPVHYLACANHDPEMLRKVVMSGGDINARASDGTTPMAVAAFKRAPEVFFRMMLSLGADPALETRLSRNPLYYMRNNDESSIQPGDVRLILLDPKIYEKQVLALACGLVKRLGKDSQVSRLNRDLIAMIGQFVMGVRQLKCEASELEYSC